MDKTQAVKRLNHAKSDLLKVDRGCDLTKLQKESLDKSIKSVSELKSLVTDDTLNRHFAKLLNADIREIAHDVDFGRSMHDVYDCLDSARQIINDHLDHKSVVYKHVHSELYGVGSVEDNIKSTTGTGSFHDITPGAIVSSMILDNLKTINYWIGYNPYKDHKKPNLVENVSVHSQMLNL